MENKIGNLLFQLEFSIDGCWYASIFAALDVTHLIMACEKMDFLLGKQLVLFRHYPSGQQWHVHVISKICTKFLQDVEVCIFTYLSFLNAY